MQTTSSDSSPSSASCCAPASGRWFADRALLVAAAAVVVLGGAAATGGWGWLVAAGIAPVLLSVLPCLVMCGLGLCMMRRGSGDAAGQAGGSAPMQPAADTATVNSKRNAA